MLAVSHLFYIFKTVTCLLRCHLHMNDVYSVDTKKVPDDLRDTLKKRLGDYETTYSGIVIPTLSQP